MKPHDKSILNITGKALACPLSRLVANSITAGFSQLAEAYWCILLGKGSGTGWDFESEINAAKALIDRTEPIIFDVGANVGNWSSRIHELFPKAELFLFEPQSACQKLIAEKKIPRSTLIQKAVSSKGGQVIRMFTSGETSGIASIHQRRDSYFSQTNFTTFEISTLSLDDFIEENYITHVDFLKIDVEGHELEVLRGAIKSLEKKIIKSLSFEFGSGNINSRTFFRDFWDLLTALGYSIKRVLPSSQLLPIKVYYEDCEYFRGVTNYVATIK